MRHIALSLIALILLAFPAASQSRADPEAATGWTPRPEAAASRQMIVTANPHATEAGLAVLRAGGSAADATVAALFVLNVVEPQSSGIGGGAFALVHGPEGLISLDGRETAPAAAGPDLFLGADGAPMAWWDAVPTARSVGVPGLVALMAELHGRHGRLPWARLVAPAYALARDGFTVSPRLAGLIEAYADALEGSEAGEILMPGGQPLSAGARLRQPALATTLADLALIGPQAFYEGRIAEAITAAVAREDGAPDMQASDLAAYRVVERAPVCAPYRSWRICGMGPPSSGATTVGQILGLMARFRDAPAGAADPVLWHRFAEASQLAYADRARYLADPDHVAVPVAGLLDERYLLRRSGRIGARASRGVARAGTPPGAAADHAPGTAQTSPGTTHLSVIDRDGLAVSLTASIETAFGSRRMAAGFILNNQLTDFSFAPVAGDGRPVANAPGPGKRPRSSMAPTIAYRAGETAPALLLGSPGGSRIPEYVARALVGIIDLGLGPAQAAALFHLSERNRGAVVLEEGVAPEGLAEGLRALGHSVSEAPMTSGLAIIARAEDGRLTGAADPRREGVAAGD